MRWLPRLMAVALFMEHLDATIVNTTVPPLHTASAPVLAVTLLRVRTFRVSVLGGFVTRLGVGGMPFLLPLLYQLGLGYAPWQAGLLTVPQALAAMGMKAFSVRLLRRFGH